MESKFKVGDIVVFTKLPDYAPATRVDVEYQITGEDEEYGLFIIDDEGDRNYCPFEQPEDYGVMVVSKNEEMVESPSHYNLFPGIEAIQVIASSLTVEEYRGYCLGNLLKYRLRCGKKDNVEQELAKADMYKKLFEQHKHLCKDM